MDQDHSVAGVFYIIYLFFIISLIIIDSKLYNMALNNEAFKQILYVTVQICRKRHSLFTNLIVSHLGFISITITV